MKTFGVGAVPASDVAVPVYAVLEKVAEGGCDSRVHCPYLRVRGLNSHHGRVQNAVDRVHGGDRREGLGHIVRLG